MAAAQRGAALSAEAALQVLRSVLQQLLQRVLDKNKRVQEAHTPCHYLLARGYQLALRLLAVPSPPSKKQSSWLV